MNSEFKKFTKDSHYDKLQTLSAIFYFSPIILLNNPFYAFRSEAKFTLAFFVIFISWLLLRQKNLNIPVKIIVFLSLLSISCLRINESYNLEGISVTNTVILQILFSMYVCIMSFLILPNISKSNLTIALFAILTIYYYVVFVQREYLIFSIDKNSKVGDLSPDSYQYIGFVFGIYAISNLYFIKTNIFSYYTIFCGLNIFLILYLTLFSSGRGEALALLIALGFMLNPIISVFTIFFSYYIIVWIATSFDYPLFDRIKVFFVDGDFGGRDIVFSQAFEYAGQNLFTFLFGGGINAFQNFFQYHQGLYPHNILLESLTTGGILFVLSVFFITIWPLSLRFFSYVTCRTPWNSWVFGIGIFNVILVLKSGTIVSLFNFLLFLPILVNLKADRIQP
jgi:hypothetical protein